MVGHLERAAELYPGSVGTLTSLANAGEDQFEGAVGLPSIAGQLKGRMREVARKKDGNSHKADAPIKKSPFRDAI
jgi:hypothetical protein